MTPRLDDLRTGDGRPLPHYLKDASESRTRSPRASYEQIKAVEAARNAVVTPGQPRHRMSPQVSMLVSLRGIGQEFANVLYSEGLFRHFDNCRQVAAYSGLARPDGRAVPLTASKVSKAGNPHLRSAMVELAWLWTRHQPESALSRWFRECTKIGGTTQFMS